MIRPWLCGMVLGVIGVMPMAPLAQAQGAPSGCLFDRCEDKQPLPAAQPAPQSSQAESGGFLSRPTSVAPGNFDFYVLSLSWSPSFCASHTDSRNANQCAVGRALGFVVHGLWPQYEQGFPSDCDGPRSPSQLDLQASGGVYPDLGLARYEWRKHGTCTGNPPSVYFADVRRARAMVRVPEGFGASGEVQSMSPAAVEQAFEAANPRLRPGMLAVECLGGLIQEVRVCLTKDLRDFRSCPQVARSACRSANLSVPPPR